MVSIENLSDDAILHLSSIVDLPVSILYNSHKNKHYCLGKVFSEIYVIMINSDNKDRVSTDDYRTEVFNVLIKNSCCQIYNQEEFITYYVNKLSKEYESYKYSLESTIEFYELEERIFVDINYVSGLNDYKQCIITLIDEMYDDRFITENELIMKNKIKGVLT